MNILGAIILSIIEGITEFLPISSTGHLLLAANLLSIEQTDFTKTFEIVIQVGAILAVFSLYLKRLFSEHGLWRPIIVAFVPTAVVGIVFYGIIKNIFFESTLITTIALGVGGVCLIFFERQQKKSITPTTLATVTNKQAFIVGLFQSISIVPGVSRAAASIVGGMVIGLPRAQAIEFSFLLAIPTIVAAAGLDLLSSTGIQTSSELSLLIFGSLTAFIVARITIRYFLRYIQHHTLELFGWYRVALAVVFFLATRIIQ